MGFPIDGFWAIRSQPWPPPLGRRRVHADLVTLPSSCRSQRTTMMPPNTNTALRPGAGKELPGLLGSDLRGQWDFAECAAAAEPGIFVQLRCFSAAIWRALLLGNHDDLAPVRSSIKFETPLAGALTGQTERGEVMSCIDGFVIAVAAANKHLDLECHVFGHPGLSGL